MSLVTRQFPLKLLIPTLKLWFLESNFGRKLSGNIDGLSSDSHQQTDLFSCMLISRSEARNRPPRSSSIHNFIESKRGLQVTLALSQCCPWMGLARFEFVFPWNWACWSDCNISQNSYRVLNNIYGFVTAGELLKDPVFWFQFSDVR